MSVDSVELVASIFRETERIVASRRRFPSTASRSRAGEPLEASGSPRIQKYSLRSANDNFSHWLQLRHGQSRGRMYHNGYPIIFMPRGLLSQLARLARLATSISSMISTTSTTSTTSPSVSMSTLLLLSQSCSYDFPMIFLGFPKSFLGLSRIFPDVSMICP